jgi:hypothetical protein
MDLPGYAGRNRTDHLFRKIENCSVEPRAGLSKATGKSVHRALCEIVSAPSAEHTKPDSEAKQIHRALCEIASAPVPNTGSPIPKRKAFITHGQKWTNCRLKSLRCVWARTSSPELRRDWIDLRSKSW